MKKILFVFILLVSVVFLFSCSIAQTIKYDNQLKNYTNADASEKNYQDYVKFKVATKNNNFTYLNGEVAYVIKVEIIKNYNLILNDETLFSKYINEKKENNEQINLIVSKELYQVLDIDMVFVYRLRYLEVVKDKYNSNYKFFSTVNNEETLLFETSDQLKPYLIQFYSDFINLNTNIDIDLSILITKTYMYYRYSYLAEMFAENYYEFGFDPLFLLEMQQSNYLFELALLKHKNLDNGGKRWNKHVNSMSLNNLSFNDLESDLLYLNQFTENNDNKFVEIDDNYYNDLTYFYLILSNDATYSKKEYTKQEIIDFLPVYISDYDYITLDELNKEIYEEIKQRLDGLEVREEIQNIDLDNYHRVLILTFNQKPNYDSNLFYSFIKELENEKDFIYAWYNQIHFMEEQHRVFDLNNFVKIKIDKIIEEYSDKTLVECIVLEDYNQYLSSGISESSLNNTINLIIPNYIIPLINDFEFIYKLDNALELEIEGKRIDYYSVLNNMQYLYPIYNGHYCRFLKTNNDDFNTWISKARKYYFGFINEFISGIDNWDQLDGHILLDVDSVELFKYVLMIIEYEITNNLRLYISSEHLLRYYMYWNQFELPIMK